MRLECGGAQVADIGELVHLAHLSQLRVLSLVDNPCVAATPDYRTRVRSRPVAARRSERCSLRADEARPELKMCSRAHG